MSPDDTANCTETWLPVVGYEGHYEVSDAGGVRSVSRTTTYRDGRVFTYAGQPIKAVPDPRGYLYVALWMNGHGVTRPAHQLVLEAFVGPRPEGMETLHGNGVPGDNRLGNLRWGTHAENAQDTLRHGRHNMLSKSTCPRGHDLLAPNLVPSDLPGRNCLSCNQAHALANAAADHWGPDRDARIMADADRRYALLMAGESSDQRRIPLDVPSVVALYREGLSSAEIATRLGCSGETVLRRLRQVGEPRRPQGGSGRRAS